jgi:hypothetical protein
VFDEVKVLYSVYKDWKVGLMCKDINIWEIIVQNQKLNQKLCSSFGAYISNKNWAIILKNKVSKKDWGKLNYELAVQVSL